MIVCLCTGTSDRDIHAAIDHGASTVRDLQACGIGTGCRSCHPMLRAILEARAAASDALCREAEILSAITPDRDRHAAGIIAP